MERRRAQLAKEFREQELHACLAKLAASAPRTTNECIRMQTAHQYMIDFDLLGVVAIVQCL